MCVPPRTQGLSPEDRLIVAGGGGGSGQRGECQGGAGGAAEQPGEKGDGSKTTTVNLKLTGCEPTNRFGIKCQSQGAQSGEVTFNTLEGNLGYIAGGVEPTVGLELTPTAADGGYLAQFHCGEVPISITGSVIAAYAPVNKMVTTFTVSLKQTKGLQTPEALEGGSPEHRAQGQRLTRPFCTWLRCGR
jgi:hypothetical protein